jgi:serine protease AprX
MDVLRRRVALAAGIAALALTAGVAGTAEAAGQSPGPALIPAGLIADAQANPQQSFNVIVRGTRGTSSSAVGKAFSAAAHGSPRRTFKSINGVAATIKGAALVALSHNPNILSIVPDEPVAPVDIEESGLWHASTGADQVPSLLAQTAGATLPAIAVVDSGVDPTKTEDFGSRLVASVNMSSTDPTAVGDDEGHGTMVAGIAAGGAAAFPGVVPTAPIVSIRTADATGASLTSDVIAACDWILAHQAQYDIRVANFSLVSGSESSFTSDPLDAAVEQLWFHGIVVVAASGNYGDSAAVPMDRSPGNDPFVVTVGALDTNGTADPTDDFVAPWSAYGHSGDGFAKPEISAPGRWIAAPVPVASTLATTAPDRIVAPGYMWMSGTSLAAPIVAGAADAILAVHPDWTPGQVKGALMVSASPLPTVSSFAGGVGELNASGAMQLASAPDADSGLEQFVKSDGSGFDGTAWEQAVQTQTDWSATDWSATDWSATDWSATDWSATDWSATDWSATDWSATDWSATDWSATDWSATDWSATDWSATDWSAALWQQ